MNRPPIISDGAWREIGEDGRAEVAAAWQRLRENPRRTKSQFFGMLDGLWSMSEVSRIQAITKQLSERGPMAAPYAVRGSRLGRLLPLLNDAELDELETLVRWCANAERDEDRVYLSGELEAHLQRLEARL